MIVPQTEQSHVGIGNLSGPEPQRLGPEPQKHLVQCPCLSLLVSFASVSGGHPLVVNQQLS